MIHFSSRGDVPLLPGGSLVTGDDTGPIREGRCPIHLTPLVRCDGCGWCHECDGGWSYESKGTNGYNHDRIGFHFAAKELGILTWDVGMR
jgi:hypothetical protein